MPAVLTVVPRCPQVDANDNIWVPILVNAAANTTGGAGGQSTKLVTIAPGIGSSLTPTVSLTSLPFLGGIGDQTGRYTAQPPATGTWTWVHDTNYPGAFAPWFCCWRPCIWSCSLMCAYKRDAQSCANCPLPRHAPS